MTNSTFPRKLKKKVKADHKKEKLMNPEWFETQRIDMAKEILAGMSKVRWGAFKFNYVSFKNA